MKKRVIAFLITAALPLSSCGISRGKATLSNPHASPAASEVYRYLCSTEGKATLSGQQESTWMGSVDYETEYIEKASGKLPAIRGFDYMNDDFAGVNERAARWWNRGGLVTICWHTGADFNGSWDEAMNTEIPDWERIFDEDTPEHESFIESMDKAAKALGELREQGVVVLWRPFHEFDGRWFWWGKGGPDNFKKLWRLMYKRYTEHWGLDNLIWVLGFSHNGEKLKKWYPGNKYCDIVGADSYDGGAQPGLYEALRKLNAKNKTLCFHECGANPTAEEFAGTPWLWFMTWHTEYLTDNNPPEALKTLYNSENIVTLEQLPAFSNKAAND